ncbi:MAG: MaoC/PaaZ C-terminal domain-containing protein [Candidatus Heimdallarchaeota archaeon]
MRFSVFKTFRRGVKIKKNDINLAYTFPKVLIEHKKLEQYRVFFEFSDKLPFPYLYILAQRAQVALMLNPGFTISVPGMIHINNKLIQYETINPKLPIELETSISVEAKSEGSLFPKAEVIYYQDGIKVALCESGYLIKRKSKSSNIKTMKQKIEIPKLSLAIHSVSWNISKSLGKKYSKVSGDKNPIHNSRLFARFMGFKQPIIHGWCSVSQVIKEVSQLSNKVNEVMVNFNKPIFLPSTVQIDFEEFNSENNTIKFNVQSPSNGLIHLYGYVKSK